MARFIELHNNGRAVLINLDSVQLINHKDGTVRIFFIGEERDLWLEVDESFSDMKRLVMQAEMNKP